MAGDAHGIFPPFSRLFIIGDKKATEEDYKATFGEYGEPVTTTFIKDRNGDNKGLVYIQMRKTSEACKAVESLNGACVGTTTRSMKVLIATNRSDAASDEDIMAQVSRLFVVVPKTYSEADVTKVFEKYGTLKKVVTVKDKKTQESRGLAFVTFNNASDAANAYENCDSDYRPKFADPVPRKRQHEDGDDRYGRAGERMTDRMGLGGILPRPGMGGNDNFSSMSKGQGPAEFLASFPHNNQFYLKVRVPKGLTQHQLTRLFNIVPTLEFCRLGTNQFSTTDTAIVGFSSASCCSYAKEALHGFEYPPGCPLDIEYYDNSGGGSQDMDTSGGYYNSNSAYNQGNSGYQRSDSFNDRKPRTGGAGYGDSTSRGRYREPTPPSGGNLVPDSETRKRLFIVSQPERISTRTLSDMFCRFGNLISVNYIPGKNYGFAKFASIESADNAQKYMHGETIDGNHLKCLDAEDPPPDSKRAKSDR